RRLRRRLSRDRRGQPAPRRGGRARARARRLVALPVARQKGRRMTPAPISVVVDTRDAARVLAFDLRSVAPWASEIVVVDMESGDDTVAIARAHGARVLTHPRADCVEAARAFAVAAAREPWVLVLDADELVPLALSRRLRAVAA